MKPLKTDEEFSCDSKYRGRRVSGKEGDTRGWGNFNYENPLKGLISAHKVLQNFPINDSLVSFVLVMINNEFCPTMFYHNLFGRLGSLLFLDWPISASVVST